MLKYLKFQEVRLQGYPCHLGSKGDQKENRTQTYGFLYIRSTTLSPTSPARAWLEAAQAHFLQRNPWWVLCRWVGGPPTRQREWTLGSGPFVLATARLLSCPHGSSPLNARANGWTTDKNKLHIWCHCRPPATTAHLFRRTARNPT